MSDAKGPIIDGDGHIIENTKEIIALMPPAYAKKFAKQPFLTLFPPLDHLHYCNLHDIPEGGFNFNTGVEEWYGFLEEVGIEKTVLYPTGGLAMGKIVNPDWAIDATRAYNDWLHQTYMKRSPKFNAVALLPMQSPDAAVEELRRAVKELGMRGAMLPSTGVLSHVGHERYWPIYEEANRLGCAIAVHGGAHSGMGMDDLYPYAGVHSLGHPYGQMIAFASVIMNGLPDRFPNVKFAFLEAGVAWLFLCLERFDRSYFTHIQNDPRNKYITLRPKEKVADYIARHIDEGRLFVGCEGEEPDIAYAIKRLSNKPFVFSSDFPHEVNIEGCKHEIEELRENMEITAADKHAVLYENSKRLYSF